MNLLEIYSDFLIYQLSSASATSLSRALDYKISHDKITRFLNSEELASPKLWAVVKPLVRERQDENGVLIIDDSISEKPYTDESEINAWHFSSAKKRCLKGIQIQSLLVNYGEVTLPIGYEIIKKNEIYVDKKSGKLKRKSEVTKNELCREMFLTAIHNNVPFAYILGDSWFGAKETMELIHLKKKSFIFSVKSNRLVALSKDDYKNGIFKKISDLNLGELNSKIVYLKALNFAVLLGQKVFKNKDGSSGTLYLVSNDIALNTESIFEIYKRRWKIEEYHQSIKQNTSLSKSPTKSERTQRSHIFCSIYAFVKLEQLKFKKKLNHYQLRSQLLVKAMQAAARQLFLAQSS